MKILLLVLSVTPIAAHAADRFVGLWQFPNTAVWVRISNDNTVFQCRIAPTGHVIESKGELKGSTIFWQQIWGKDVVTIENGKLFLDGKYGKFGYIRSLTKMAEQCMNEE